MVFADTIFKGGRVIFNLTCRSSSIIAVYPQYLSKTFTWHGISLLISEHKIFEKFFLLKNLKLMTMKNSIKFFGVIFALIVLSSSANAFGPFEKKSEEKVDKVTQKAREAVSNATADDWLTYAKSAEKCIKKGVNLKEAGEWIDKSLTIKESPYNLTIKGDYFLASNLPDKALEFYVKGLKVGKSEDINFNGTYIQERIAEIYQLN